MNTQTTLDWLAPLMASDAPALPSVWAMQWGLQWSWAVVLACLGSMLVGRWTAHKWLPLGAALPLAAWALLPGSYSASYWLGLVFQAPSITAVLCCAALLGTRLVQAFPQRAKVTADETEPKVHSMPCGLAWPVLGVLLGWALLLDTFALLPVPLYAWGFSPLATALVLLLAFLPWVWWHMPRGTGCWLWLTPLAVFLFVLLRLPSGNVWDAVLDPLLWLGLQGYLLRRLWTRYQ